MEKRKFYDYYVYENGRVFSLKTNRFLIGDIAQGYVQYTLSINKESKRFKAHRLVAMLWLDNEKGYNVVNHKDGNKLNNHYTNLEWCSYYDNNKHARETWLNNISKSNSDRWNDDSFRERVSKKISETRKQRDFSGSKNSNSKYLITKDGLEITRQEAAQITGYALSTVDGWIKKVANGKVSKRFEKYGIKVENIDKGQQTIENVA